MSRNYRKEYDNYHSRPEQKIRRAARNAARAKFKDADPNKDVHHKDNNPLNNDKNNLSLVTQHYNRREPRLREWENAAEGIDSDAMINLMQKYLNTKNKNEKKTLLKQINRYQKKLGLKVTEDMGTVTGPHIAGTGDDSSTVKVRKKKKVRRRKEEINLKSRMAPSMKDWEKRDRLSKQIRQKFWQQFRKDKKKDVKLKFKLKNSRSLRKRIIDNVLAIQQKV